MAYYLREEQETLIRYDVLDSVWTVDTTYPKHIKQLQFLAEKSSQGVQLFLTEFDTKGNCIAATLKTEKVTVIKGLLSRKRYEKESA